MHKLVITKDGAKRVPLTRKEIAVRKAEELQAQAELKANQYINDRKAAYPPIEDQLDTIYHKGVRAWKKEIRAIKEEFPKPEIELGDL